MPALKTSRSRFSRFLLTMASLIVLLCGAPHYAQAEGETCSNYIPAEIDIQPIFDEIKYELTTPMLKIKDLANGEKSGAHSEAWPVGLSTGEIYFSVTTDIMKMRTGYSNMSCGQVKAVHVKFGFKDNKIYVAKEFPKRSCPFKTVLAHEEKHKAVDRALVDEYTEKTRTMYEAAAKKIGMVRAGSAFAIDENINSVLNDTTNKLSSELEAEHARRQKEIDSPEEYQRVTDSCDGRTMETVQQRLEIMEQSHPGISKARSSRSE